MFNLTQYNKVLCDLLALDVLHNIKFTELRFELIPKVNQVNECFIPPQLVSFNT